MKLHMSLDYTISEGELKPYFDALLRGDALASRCQSCGHVAFPARVICNDCGSRELDWAVLPGTAQVIHRTDGAKSAFALAKFSGADTLTTLALTNPASKATTGRLSTPVGARPGLWLNLDETI